MAVSSTYCHNTIYYHIMGSVMTNNYAKSFSGMFNMV